MKLVFAISRKNCFSYIISVIISGNLKFERFCENLKNGSMDFFKTLDTRA